MEPVIKVRKFSIFLKLFSRLRLEQRPITETDRAIMEKKFIRRLQWLLTGPLLIIGLATENPANSKGPDLITKILKKISKHFLLSLSFF